MNKTELIAAVAEKAEISKKDEEKAIRRISERREDPDGWFWYI